MAKTNSMIKNMRNLSPQQRLEAVSKALNCNHDLLNDLKGEGSLPLKIADGMIENVVGRFELPLGIATNFQVNGKDYLIPMAVEEPSVVAAASHMAKLARMNGGFQAVSDRPLQIANHLARRWQRDWQQPPRSRPGAVVLAAVDHSHDEWSR